MPLNSSIFESTSTGNVRNRYHINGTMAALANDTIYSASTAASTVALPQTPSVGDSVRIIRETGSWGTNPLTIDVTGVGSVNGTPMSSMSLDKSVYRAAIFIYTGSTWSLRYEFVDKVTSALISAAAFNIPHPEYVLVANTATIAMTATMPALAQCHPGTSVEIVDARSNAAALNITVDFNGVPFHTIVGDTFVINVNRGSAKFTYANSTQGWVLNM